MCLVLMNIISCCSADQHKDGWATRCSADWDQASADLQGEINISETSDWHKDTNTLTYMLVYLSLS